MVGQPSDATMCVTLEIESDMEAICVLKFTVTEGETVFCVKNTANWLWFRNETILGKVRPFCNPTRNQKKLCKVVVLQK